jgi:hypothetical protein
MKRSSMNQSQTTVEMPAPLNKRDVKAACKESRSFLSETESKILSKSCLFARKFNGECLSQTDDATTTHISMVKGQPSIKFKCHQGHVFYKATCEMDSTTKLDRKFSMSTAASSSNNSDEDSDDSDKTWCPKCVAFYRNC